MDLQLFAHPTSAQQMMSDYQQGVAGVSLEDYCAPQIELGVSQAVCAARFNRYQRRTQGKAQKFLTRWQSS